MQQSEIAQVKSGWDGRLSGEGWFTGVGVLLLVLFSISACLPSCARRHGRSEQVVAMNNGKSLVLALNDFAAEYGSFPDRSTAAAVKSNTGTTLDLDGDTANDYFRQLIAAGVSRSEDPFFARTPYSLRNPDNNIIRTAALKPGEVGFGYLMNGAKAMPNDDPNRIIAVTPLLNASPTGEFDPEALEGSAMLVYLDSSVSRAILKDHQATTIRGHSLLTTGPGTIWGTTITPVIKPPQTPPGWVPKKLTNKMAGQWWWLLGAGTTFALLAGWVVVKRRAAPPRA